MKITNVFKPHIVKFKNGNYAVRKYSLFYFCYVYKDVSSTGEAFWWSIDEKWFHHCKCTFEEATEVRTNIPTTKKRDKHIDKGAAL